MPICRTPAHAASLACYRAAAHLEDLQAARLIRQPDLDLHLQAPRPQQRLIEHVLSWQLAVSNA